MIVRAAGAVLAWQNQSVYNNTEHETVAFKYTDATGMSRRTGNADGTIHNYGGSEDSPVELDPLGGSVGMHTPYIYLNPNPGEPDIAPPLTSTWNSYPGQVGQQSNAVIDGVQVPLWFGLAAEAGGSAVRCPNNYCGSVTTVNSAGQTVLTSPFQAFANGKNGYSVPKWDRLDLVIDGETIYGEPNLTYEFKEVSNGNTSWDPVQQTRQSRNMRNFNEAVQAVRDILSQAGSNPCANFFAGAGLDALDAIVDAVNSQGEDTFTNRNFGNDTSTGIRMGIPRQVNPGDVGNPVTILDPDGRNPLYKDYVAVAPTSVDNQNPVSINTRGPFVSGLASRIGNYAPATLQSRVLQLLHEIGHLVITETSPTVRTLTQFNPPRRYNQLALTHLLAPDGRNSGLSARNTEEVEDACGNQINALDD